MSDTDLETIKQLFYRQIRNMTLNKTQTMDYQFSDRWLAELKTRMEE